MTALFISIRRLSISNTSSLGYNMNQSNAIINSSDSILYSVQSKMIDLHSTAGKVSIRAPDLDEEPNLEMEEDGTYHAEIKRLHYQKRYPSSKSQDNFTNTGRWNTMEKSLFTQGVTIYGRGNWRSIADFVHTRYVSSFLASITFASNKIM